MVGILNGALIVLLSRKLGPDDFSIYVATVSLVTVVGSFTLGIRTLTAKNFATSSGNEFPTSQLLKSVTFLNILFSIFWIFGSIVLKSSLHIPLVYLLVSTSIISTSVFGSYAAGVLQGLKKFHTWQGLILLTSTIQIPLILFPVGRQLGVGYFLLILAIPSGIFFLITVLITKNILVNRSENFSKIALLEGVSLGSVTLMLQGPIFCSRWISDESLSVSTTSVCLLFLTLCGLSSTLGSYLLPDHVNSNLVKVDFMILRPHIINSVPLLFFGLIVLVLGSKALEIIFGESLIKELPRSLLLVILGVYAIWSIGQSLLHSCINSLNNSLPYKLTLLAGTEIFLLFLNRNNIYGFFLSFGAIAVLFLILVLSSFPKITD